MVVEVINNCEVSHGVQVPVIVPDKVCCEQKVEISCQVATLQMVLREQLAWS